MASLLLLVSVSQPLNALAFVADGILFGFNGFAFSAVMMFFAAAPAIATMTTVRVFDLTGTAATGAIWAGLALLMALRAAIGVGMLAARRGPFARLREPQSDTTSPPPPSAA